MTVFHAATLRTFFFAFHAGAKELNLNKDHFNFQLHQKSYWPIEKLKEAW